MQDDDDKGKKINCIACTSIDKHFFNLLSMNESIQKFIFEFIFYDCAGTCTKILHFIWCEYWIETDSMKIFIYMMIIIASELHPPLDTKYKPGIFQFPI